MALNDYQGMPILGGTWMYDGVLPMRVLIVACDHDRDYASRQDDRLYWTDADYDADEDDGGEDEPSPLGPDGRLYYVGHTWGPPHQTLEAAKAWVDAQPWGPANWDE